MSNKRFLAKYDNKKYGWLHFAIELVVGIVIFLLLLSFVLGISRVDGNSMYPTLNDNQRVVYLRVGNSIEKGKIIAIKMPSGDSYVKRIIATEGDTVDIKDGSVYVNGKKQNEPYAQGATETVGTRVKYPLTVNKDEVFVLGDNRENSVDSRTFGSVIKENIKGTLIGNK